MLVLECSGTCFSINQHFELTNIKINNNTWSKKHSNAYISASTRWQKCLIWISHIPAMNRNWALKIYRLVLQTLTFKMVYCMTYSNTLHISTMVARNRTRSHATSLGESRCDIYQQKGCKSMSTKVWEQVDKKGNNHWRYIKRHETWSLHTYRARYQHHQEQILIANLDHAFIHVDFCENMSLVAQDECENPVFLKQSVVQISDNLKHDSDAVYNFTAEILRFFLWIQVQ